MSKSYIYNYNSLDFVKWVMAVFVVAIHTNPQAYFKLYWIENMFVSLYSLAVPYFFVTSGFLLWFKCKDYGMKEKLTKIKKWLKRILRLYIVWTIIYLPFTIYGFYNDGLPLIKSLIVFFRNVLLIGQNYWSWPLWYLLAMLVAGSIIYVLEKFAVKNYIKILLGGIFVFLAYFLNSCYQNPSLMYLVEPYFKLFQTTRNGFFEGFPYMMIGIIIASYGVLKNKFILLLLLLIGYIAHYFDLFGAAYLMAYAFFSLVIQMPFNKMGNNTSLKFRLSSTVLYFVHMIWYGILKLFVHNISPLSMFLIVVLLSLLSSQIIIYYRESSLVRYCFK